jgi:ubiquinone/menaquinone biosynthesis C-methylase UbiE
MVNTNTWNKIRYTIYRPIYNVIDRYFRPKRKRSIETLGLQSGQKVLIIGAGTGLDLDLLPKDIELTVVDITPAMVKASDQRAQELGMEIDSYVMDGSNLVFDDQSFDIVILHLILAVIPDPVGCITETERVLKPGGMCTIMDKFVAPGKTAGFLRKTVNLLTNLLATSITRNVDELLTHTQLEKIRHERLSSLFWLIQARKRA